LFKLFEMLKNCYAPLGYGVWGCGLGVEGFSGFLALIGAFLRFLVLVQFLALFGAQFWRFGAFLEVLVQKFGYV